MFGTRATRLLTDPKSKARRAPVWVFALHTSIPHTDGWRFFVVPGALLDLVGKGSISVNSLMARGYWAIEPDELQGAVVAAFELSQHGARIDANDLRCPKCGLHVPTPQHLAAHQVTKKHTISVRELLDDELLKGRQRREWES